MKDHYAYDLALRALTFDLIHRSSGSHYFHWLRAYAPTGPSCHLGGWWNSELIEETP